MTAPGLAFGGQPWESFGLGLLTAVQPCALATLAAQVAWVCSWSGKSRAAFARGAAMVVGMCATYAIVAALAAWLAGTIPAILKAVTLYIRPFFGPTLLLVGTLVAGVFGDRGLAAPRFPARLERLLGGTAASCAMGILMAGALCPATAGIFFLLLVPAAVLSGHPVQAGLLYGLGAALPMLALVAAVAAGGRGTSWAAAGWVRRAAGFVMLAVGGFLTVRLVLTSLP